MDCHLYLETEQLVKLIITTSFSKELCPFLASKVQIFWEGHKILQNFHLTFDYSTYSQNQSEDFANFVAFSEYMNFT